MSIKFQNTLTTCVLVTAAWSWIACTQAGELFDPGEMPVAQYESKLRQAPDFLFGYAGGVAVHTKRIVGSNRNITVPLPILGVNYKDILYWNVTKGGAWLWKSRGRALKFGPLIKLRMAVNTDNDDQIAQLSNRKGSLEAGLGFSWLNYLKTSLELYQDISGRSDGASVQLKVSKFIKLNDHLTSVPSLTMEWLSKDVVNYYYGVNATESASSGITPYQGRSTTNARAGITVANHITKNWALLGGVIYQRYGKGITDSSIVTKSANAAIYLGAAYLFVKM